MKKKQYIIDLVLIYYSIFLSGLSGGMLSVLISITMESNINSDILISVAFSTQIIAGIIFAKYLPHLASKFGMFKTIYLTTTIASVMMVLMYNYIGYFSWLVIIFIFGASLFSFATTRQTLMIELSPAKSRAMIISMGVVALALGSSLGSYLVKFMGFGGFWAFFNSALIQFLAIIPLFFIKGLRGRVRENKKISLLRYIKNSPKIMLAGLCFHYISTASYSFIIIYGLKIGMANEKAAFLFTVLLFGTVFSVPMGYLTDRINRRFLILFCTIISLVFAISLSILAPQHTDVTYVLLFLMFGFAVGIRLPALVLINEKYKPSQRLAVNSAFGKICAIGNICGAFFTGVAMEFHGEQGLWLSIILILTLYLLFTIGNYLYKFFTNSPVLGKFFVEPIEENESN